jgi:hypothetical protein
MDRRTGEKRPGSKKFQVDCTQDSSAPVPERKNGFRRLKTIFATLMHPNAML